MAIKNQVSMTTNIGGRGGSATPGGYNQGNSFSANRDSSSQGVNAQHKDLRGGTATVGGYNQGPTVAGNHETGTQGVNIMHKDLRGGSSNPSSGYNQGSTVTASKK
jgi:hypothetical protein